jgi:sodium/bile acid cotransporter 7
MQDAAAARKWYHPVPLIWAFLGQWFLWGTGVAIVLAWRWPDVAKSGGSE